MGSNYGVKCRCNKKGKKSQRPPQRGPGVAELEKILSNENGGQRKPFYAPPFGSFMYHQPSLLQQPFSGLHYPQLHNFGIPSGGFSSMMRSEPIQEANLDPDSGLSFTQMMMMDEPVFQPTMNNSYPSSVVPYSNPTANSVLDPFTHHQHSLTQRFYNKDVSAWPEYNQNAVQYPMNRSGPEMASDPRRLYAQQQGQPIMQNNNAPALSEHERMILRSGNEAESSNKYNLKSHGDILTLRPPNQTEQATRPISVEPVNSSESRSGEEQYKGHQKQNIGLSMDETKPSLHHNALPGVDLTLKL